MSERSESHGWTFVGTMASLDGQPVRAGAIRIGEIIDERHRCACTVEWPYCANRATQEDLRCDYCRENCP